MNLSGYKIQFSTDNSTFSTLVASQAGTSYTHSSRSLGTTYYYKVSALNSLGESAAASASVITHNIPGAPTSLTATAGSFSVALSWSAPTSNGGATVTGYKIRHSTDSGVTFTDLETNNTTTSYSHSNLILGSTHYYRVFAINSAGTSTLYTSANATLPRATALPTAPQSLSASASNDGRSVTLTWQAPSSTGGIIDGYRIESSSTSSSSGYTVLVASQVGLTYTHTSLNPGTTYYYRVAAVNAIGTGPTSSYTSVTTPTNFLPTKPQSFKVVLRTNGTSADLSWTAPSSNGNSGSTLTGYTVQYAQGAAQPTQNSGWSNIASGGCSGLTSTATSCTHTGLANAKVYWYRIMATNNSNIKGFEATERLLTYSSTAMSPSFVSEPMRISAGWYHTCIVTSSGGVKCWGRNNYGQLGNGTTTNSNTPVDVTGLASGVASVSVGEYHTCAVTKGGGVKCWGYNGYGQLGDGTNTNSSTPVDVTGLTSGVASVSAGGYHTCVATTGGGVKCWGYNSYGQLGNGTTTSSRTPIDVTGLTSGVTSVSAGGSHTCAVTSSGGVKCWGGNDSGQLGNGTRTMAKIPTDVLVSINGSPLSGVTFISAGFNENTCAVMSSGSAKCWGNGGYHLGLGQYSSTDKVVPANVVSLNNAKQISSGSAHTCSVTNLNQVKCWGSRSDGRLGLSSSTATPTALTINATQQVTAGSKHTCALLISGKVQCWGEGSYGRLGRGASDANSDGYPDDSYTPVDVHTSSTDSTALNVGRSYATRTCYSNGICLSFDPTPSVTGTDNTPTFAIGGLKSRDSIYVYSDSTCSTQKGTATVAAGSTQASTALSDLGIAGTYKLYFKIKNSANYYSSCQEGPSYTFSAPNAPQNIAASSHGTKASISWEAPQSLNGTTITGYVVQYYQGETAPTTWPAYSASTNQACVTNLATATHCTHNIGSTGKGNKYWYRVWATSSGASSPVLVTSAATSVASAVPSAPRSPTTSVSGTNVTISWTEPASLDGATITGYAVQYYRGTAAPTHWPAYDCQYKWCLHYQLQHC